MYLFKYVHLPLPLRFIHRSMWSLSCVDNIIIIYIIYSQGGLSPIHAPLLMTTALSSSRKIQHENSWSYCRYRVYVIVSNIRGNHPTGCSGKSNLSGRPNHLTRGGRLVHYHCMHHIKSHCMWIHGGVISYTHCYYPTQSQLHHYH